jgi:hypothetical protein
LLQVPPGGGVFAQEEQGVPKRLMGFQEVGWHGLALRQRHELFSQLPRGQQHPTILIEPT